jgi:hypothetical protein
MMAPAINPSVGLLWGFPAETGGFHLLFTTVELSQASRYGECLTDERGHQEVWDGWRRMSQQELKALGIPVAVKTGPYERWPRGRVIYEIPLERFVIYADRRLHERQTIVGVRFAFGLANHRVWVRTDDHYRTLPSSSWI